MCINRNTDYPSRHISLEFFCCCIISGMWSAVSHRNTETLCRADNNICIPFSGRSKQSKTKQVGSNGNRRFIFMSFIHKITIINNCTFLIWILNDSSENFIIKFKFIKITNFEFYSKWHSTGFNNINCLREHIIRHKENIGFTFYSNSRACIKQHYHCFGSSSSLIKQ